MNSPFFWLLGGKPCYVFNIQRCELQTQPQDWSDQETLLLLEGLELHKDRWGEIADHVGTKSQVQCILHFLQLPIEDDYLDQLEAPPLRPAGTGVNNGSNEQAATEDAPIPFADTGNPILSQASSLIAVCLACPSVFKSLCLLRVQNRLSGFGLMSATVTEAST